MRKGGEERGLKMKEREHRSERKGEKEAEREREEEWKGVTGR